MVKLYKKEFWKNGKWKIHLYNNIRDAKRSLYVGGKKRWQNIFQIR